MWPDHAATPSLLAAPEFFERLIPRNAVSCQSVVARTEALRAIGGFDGRSYYAADWLAWMRLALRGPVATLAASLANRVHAQTGTTTAGAAGLNGRDVPMTLDRAFLDAALPETLADRHDAMVALAFVDAANTLSRSGILRIAQGWAGYMAMGRAVARVPHDAGLLAHYRHKVAEAGLVAPEAPWHAVTAAPADAAGADALAQAAHDLAPLLGRLSIGVAARRAAVRAGAPGARLRPDGARRRGRPRYGAGRPARARAGRAAAVGRRRRGGRRGRRAAGLPLRRAEPVHPPPRPGAVGDGRRGGLPAVTQARREPPARTSSSSWITPAQTPRSDRATPRALGRPSSNARNHSTTARRPSASPTPDPSRAARAPWRSRA